MTQFASPVLHSLLDTDAYKLHMQQAVFHHYYDVHVAAEFRCRGDDLLGIYADAIVNRFRRCSTCACRMMNISGFLPCLSLRPTMEGYASSALTRNKSPCPTIMASWIFV
ncbi:hypothetical protein ACLK15_05345 [Escherichia coli]